MPTVNKTASSRKSADGAARELRRLRAAITVFFALDGFVFAGWVVRIPAVKSQTHASPSTLGLALLGVSAGAVVTMMFTGRLCRRFGNHPMTVICGVLTPLSVALPPLTHSAPVLGLALLVFGAVYGGLNVAMNSAAVDLIAALRRPVMPGFHAAFSLGGMIGSGLGGLVAGHLSPTRHLLGIAVLGVLVTAAAAPTLLRHRAPAPPAGVPAPRVETGAPASVRSGGVRVLVLVFGLIALCTAYGEGALADWSALHLEDDLHAQPGLAAIGYSCFALAMTIGRLTGTTLLERLGRTVILVAGGLTAAGGMLLGSLAPSVWAALLGFAVTGIGLSNIFPVAIDRAGALTGPGGVAAASTLGYGGMVLGPPAIGFMADWWSLPTALTSVALLAAVAALIGFGTRRATAAA